jgi:hypothetical protein
MNQRKSDTNKGGPNRTQENRDLSAQLIAEYSTPQAKINDSPKELDQRQKHHEGCQREDEKLQIDTSPQLEETWEYGRSRKEQDVEKKQQEILRRQYQKAWWDQSPHLHEHLPHLDPHIYKEERRKAHREEADQTIREPQQMPREAQPHKGVSRGTEHRKREDTHYEEIYQERVEARMNRRRKEALEALGSWDLGEENYHREVETPRRKNTTRMPTDVPRQPDNDPLELVWQRIMKPSEVSQAYRTPATDPRSYEENSGVNHHQQWPKEPHPKQTQKLGVRVESPNEPRQDERYKYQEEVAEPMRYQPKINTQAPRAGEYQIHKKKQYPKENQIAPTHRGTQAPRDPRARTLQWRTMEART